MPRTSSRGAIPSDLGDLISELAETQRRLSLLEAPSGESLANSVDKLTAALDSVVLPVAVYRLDSPLVSAVGAQYATVSTPVPAGYSRALVQITATAGLRSNGAVNSYGLLMCAAGVQGASENNCWTSVSGQEYGFAVSTRSEVLTDLDPGDTVDLSAAVSFPAAYTLPRVSVAGSILFLR